MLIGKNQMKDKRRDNMSCSCKDCLFYRPYKNDGYGICLLLNADVLDDGFCNYGIKRVGEYNEKHFKR